MMTKAPIGVFDSGVGGLSVLHWIRKVLPNEDLLYFADSAHAPYGHKPRDFITGRTIKLTEFLLQQNVKAVVVACNTATVAAIATLRSEFDVPIIGMEPGIKPAASLTNTGVVGVLATTQTIKSDQFSHLVNRFGSEVEVVIQECPGLVEQVEKLELDTPATRKLLERYLNALLSRRADTIVLGCTHYPHLLPLIHEIAGTALNIVDTGEAVARQVVRRIEQLDLLATGSELGSDTFWTSGSENVESTISSIWGQSVKVGRVDV